MGKEHEQHAWFPGIIGVDGEGCYFSIYLGEVQEHESFDAAACYLREKGKEWQPTIH